jgi:hypothetical protein
MVSFVVVRVVLKKPRKNEGQSTTMSVPILLVKIHYIEILVKVNSQKADYSFVVASVRTVPKNWGALLK